MINVTDESSYILNFEGTDFNGLNNYLDDINWDLLFLDSDSVDIFVDLSYEVLLVGFNLFVTL